MSVSIEDRLAIEELYSRYSVAFDIGDVETWISTFVPDAKVGDFQGHDAIREYAERRMRERPEDPESDKVHMLFNLLLDYGDDKNHIRGYCNLMRVGRSRESGNLQIIQPGPIAQFDDYRKVDGEWKFSVRGALWELPEPPTDIPGLRK